MTLEPLEMKSRTADGQMFLRSVAEAACKHLPEGYEISLRMEHGAAWVELSFPDGNPWPVPDSADKSLEDQINESLCVAKGWTRCPGNHSERKAMSLRDLGMTITQFIDCLHSHHLVIGSSPVLGHFDEEGPYGDALYFSWDDGDGNLLSVSIPHANIMDGRVVDDSIFLKDEEDREVQLSLYPTEPVRIQSLTLRD